MWTNFKTLGHMVEHHYDVYASRTLQIVPICSQQSMQEGILTTSRQFPVLSFCIRYWTRLSHMCTSFLNVLSIFINATRMIYTRVIFGCLSWCYLFIFLARQIFFRQKNTIGVLVFLHALYESSMIIQYKQSNISGHGDQKVT